MKIFKRASVLGISAVLALSFGLSGVIAQDAQQSPGGSGLSISPTRFEPTTEAGTSGTIKISFQNVTANKINAQPVINDFISDNTTGTPQLLLDQQRDDIPTIRPFFGELESFVVDAGEIVSREFDYSIPSDTPAGGYYGAIRFIATPTESGEPDPGQVALTASLAPIVLITVPGDITEQIQVRNILFYKNANAGTFFTSKPERVGVEIVNQGNGFVQPFGEVTIKNPFGKVALSYGLNSNEPRGNVLPKSTRTFQDDLSGVSIPGRYTSEAAVSFGANGNGNEVLIIKKAFWYLPYWFLGLLAILLGLLTYAGFAVRRKVATGTFKRRK